MNRCNLGVGCEEWGVCYAEAHGEPQQCGVKGKNQMASIIDMVVDLQYGSTGKGLVAGYMSVNKGYDTIMTAWGPNAGHTFIDASGRKYVHTMLANGIVGKAVKRVMIGPGSVLNLDSLMNEINSCMDHINKNEIFIYIHCNAAVVTDEDVEAEKTSMTAIGSTKKGVGAALIKKIRRDPSTMSVAHDFKHKHEIFKMHCVILLSPIEWFRVYEQAQDVLIEGAQGFGLSIHHGFYPYTTSRDVTPAQILADCGVPFVDFHSVNVIGTARTYPIRVANRFDADGNQVGWSGPHYGDQRELDWKKDLGMEPELTTVTKLPRRIFTFSESQMHFAGMMCNPEVIFINFINYVRDPAYFMLIHRSITNLVGNRVMYGVGPGVGDVITLPPEISGNAIRSWVALQERLGVEPHSPYYLNQVWRDVKDGVVSMDQF